MPTPDQRITRREFLRLSGVAGGGLVATGLCGWLADWLGWVDIEFTRGGSRGGLGTTAEVSGITDTPVSALDLRTSTPTPAPSSAETPTGTVTSTVAPTPEVTRWPLTDREAVTEGYPISRFSGFHSDFRGGNPTGGEMATWTANMSDLENRGELREKDVFTVDVLQALYNDQMLAVKWQEGVIKDTLVLTDGKMGMLADVRNMPPVFHEQVERIVAQKLGISESDAVNHAETDRIFRELLSPYRFFKIGTLFTTWGLDACQVIMNRPAVEKPLERSSQDPVIVPAQWDNQVELGEERIEVAKDRLSNKASLGAMIHRVEDNIEAAAVYGKLLELQEKMGLSGDELRIATVTRGPNGVGYIFLTLVDCESQGPLWPEEQNPNGDGSFNLIVPCGYAVTAPEATARATAKPTKEKPTEEKPTEEKTPPPPSATATAPEASPTSPGISPTPETTPTLPRPSATPAPTQPPQPTATAGIPSETPNPPTPTPGITEPATPYPTPTPPLATETPSVPY